MLLLVICLLVASAAYLGLQGELRRILRGRARSLLVFGVIDGCDSILMRVHLIGVVYRIGHDTASQQQVVLRRRRFVKLTCTRAECDAVCYALRCQRCRSDRRCISCCIWGNGILSLLIILATTHLVAYVLGAWAGILQVALRMCFKRIVRCSRGFLVIAKHSIKLSKHQFTALGEDQIVRLHLVYRNVLQSLS